MIELENSDSPIACTQEGSNNVDVVWDWNSPQAKQPKRSHRRITQSPKIPLRKHPSNNQIQNFEKIREELQSLKEAIAIPDNEECLVLSPLQEQEYKNLKCLDEDIIPLPNTSPLLDTDDLFDDSVDEQLLLCTQRVEEDLSNLKQINNNVPCVISNKESHLTDQGGVYTNSEEIVTTVFDESVAKDTTKKRHIFTRTKLDQQKGPTQTTGKVEFYRTQSFESTLEHSKEIIPQIKLDEIKRKRQEALAKLESKRKQEGNDSEYSLPSKCSPQEIEQKRLQALATREAKRQQEIIERKRQEALKRLELRRQKNAKIVKSSLTKRL
ncbi:hypothetical protein NQ318_018774 [Aromia moschata]|uniref:Uncharacterized protein n=1 Tax=Aromia moschata TaxID=1265417 RepID=A0AAV8ZG24_9CUCU|nr:hypothetical protein NQ318_018774 [Aromia moschata]